MFTRIWRQIYNKKNKWIPVTVTAVSEQRPAVACNVSSAASIVIHPLILQSPKIACYSDDCFSLFFIVIAEFRFAAIFVYSNV